MRTHPNVVRTMPGYFSALIPVHLSAVPPLPSAFLSFAFLCLAALQPLLCHFWDCSFFSATCGARGGTKARHPSRLRSPQTLFLSAGFPRSNTQSQPLHAPKETPMSTKRGCPTLWFGGVGLARFAQCKEWLEHASMSFAGGDYGKASGPAKLARWGPGNPGGAAGKAGASSCTPGVTRRAGCSGLRRCPL
jgi:hypothetical protein